MSYLCLFDRYWKNIYLIAYHYLRDAEASRDITHDIFLNLWLGREHLVIHSFPSYLKSAAKYHAFKYIKQKKKDSLSFYDDCVLDNLNRDVVINSGDYELRYEDAEGIKENLLKVLPKRCREIFVLSREKNLSIHEIAEHFSISKRTVENQLTKALQHLRIGLKKFLML